MRANLKSARKGKGLTQQQVADLLGIGLRQYQRMESGQTDGSFAAWDALEDIMCVHQRVLREISTTHRGTEGSRGTRQADPRFVRE